MRPRWQTALLLITIPVWFLPALLYVGWKEAGRDCFHDLPMAARWAFFGQKPNPLTF